MELFKHSKQLTHVINFMQAKTIIWSFSIVCCVIALSSLMLRGLNYSLEFIGGTQLEVRFVHPISINKIITSLELAKFKNPRVQYYGSTKDFMIRLTNNKQIFKKFNFDSNQEYQIAEQVLKVLNFNDNNVSLLKTEYIGSEVGEKLLEQGGIAVVVAILITMLYIAMRFEFKLAISAAITLVHNAIIVLGSFSILYCEFDLASLAAILAVIGYSLNDTIVIFDRLRENLHKYHTTAIKDLINISINQTLSRTTMTSLLTLLVVLSLLLMGGKSLFGFSFALTIGIIIGTYASICLAGHVAVWIGLSRHDFLQKS